MTVSWSTHFKSHFRLCLLLKHSQSERKYCKNKMSRCELLIYIVKPTNWKCLCHCGVRELACCCCFLSVYFVNAHLLHITCNVQAKPVVGPVCTEYILPKIKPVFTNRKMALKLHSKQCLGSDSVFCTSGRNYCRYELWNC